MHHLPYINKKKIHFSSPQQLAFTLMQRAASVPNISEFMFHIHSYFKIEPPTGLTWFVGVSLALSYFGAPVYCSP